MVDGILVFFATAHRLLVVLAFGVTPLLARPVALLILAVAGYLFVGMTALVFIWREGPSKSAWWAGIGLIVPAGLNIATALALIPEERVDVWLILDVYLLNGLIPLLVIGLLLKKSSTKELGVGVR